MSTLTSVGYTPSALIKASQFQWAHPVVGGEDSVAGCAFQPVIGGRPARAPREGAAWERGRPARILGLRDELLYSLKVFCQTLTS